MLNRLKNSVARGIRRRRARPGLTISAPRGWVTIMALSGFLVLSVAVGPADADHYYQYTDEHGNIRFTDNLFNVPEQQRDMVQEHRKVPSEPSALDVRNTGVDSTPAGAHRPAAPESSWERDLRVRAAPLDREQAELERGYQELIAEKNSLGDPPPPNAASAEKNAYRARVEALNRKIAAYEQQRERFDEKVADITAGLRTSR